MRTESFAYSLMCVMIRKVFNRLVSVLYGSNLVSPVLPRHCMTYSYLDKMSGLSNCWNTSESAWQAVEAKFRHCPAFMELSAC